MCNEFVTQEDNDGSPNSETTGRSVDHPSAGRLSIEGLTTFLSTQFANKSDVNNVVEKIHELHRPKVLPYCGTEGYDDCPVYVIAGRGLLDIPA